MKLSFVAAILGCSLALIPAEERAWSYPGSCPCGVFQETQLRNLVLVEVGSGDVVYAWWLGKLLKSEDRGENWVEVKDFGASAGCRGMFVTSTGDVILGTRGGCLTVGRPGEPWNWSTPLTFVCSGGPQPSCMWKMGEDSQGRLFVGEYGGTWSDDCAYIHRSEDGGDTWELVYSCSCRHVHFVHVDPNTDHVYASIGDGHGRQRLIRSTDGGDSWETLYDEDCLAQPTGMACTATHRVFGSDCGDICNCLYRTCDDQAFEICAVLDGAFDGYVWDMSGEGNIVVAGTVAKAEEGNEICLLLSSNGGASWYRAKDFGVGPTWSGVVDISRFDSEGYGYYTYARPEGGYYAFRFRVVPQTSGADESETEEQVTCRALTNPATGTVTLEYSLPAPFCNASLYVYTAAGRRVWSEHLDSVGAERGRVLWDGADGDRKRVASGVYFYRLESSLGEDSGSFVLLR
jgi:hypothetical protein